MWLSGLLMSSLISFGLGYNFVHSAEHKEITRLQAALESANTLSGVVFQEAEKRVASAKKEANNKDGKLDIQLHVQDDKTCKPRRLK